MSLKFRVEDGFLPFWHGIQHTQRERGLSEAELTPSFKLLKHIRCIQSIPQRRYVIRTPIPEDGVRLKAGVPRLSQPTNHRMRFRSTCSVKEQSGGSALGIRRHRNPPIRSPIRDPSPRSAVSTTSISPLFKLSTINTTIFASTQEHRTSWRTHHPSNSSPQAKSECTNSKPDNP